MRHEARQVPSWLIFDVGQNQMHRLISATVLVLVIVSACAKAPQARNRPLYPRTTVGSFTKKEVEDLRSKIANLSFPLDYSVTKFLPPGFEPDHWATFEPGLRPVKDQSSLGWNGSVYVYDYWLNEDYILRMGTGVFPAAGGPPTTRWAVIIPSSEQETYTQARHPYPKEPNKAPEPTPGSVTPRATPGTSK